MKARKRPVEIECWKIDTSNDLVLASHAGLAAEWRFAPGGFEIYNSLERCWVNMPRGHYLIRGVAGEFYPCEPEVFAKTYEVIE